MLLDFLLQKKNLNQFITMSFNIKIFAFLTSWRVFAVEQFSAPHFVLVEAWHQFVDDVLQLFIRSNAQQRPRLVNLSLANRAFFARLQMLHDATFAN